MTFTEVRDALQQEFPEVNERALGFCTRMMVPLVMYPTGRPLVLAGERAIHPGRGRGWRGSFTPSAEPEELVIRYLQAFGPATPADFQTWSGLQKAKPLFDGLELETVHR